MSVSLTIWLLVLSLLILFLVIYLLRKGRIPVKFSLVWFLVILILFAIALAPGILVLIQKLLGFKAMSNMIIGILFVILFLICITLTVMISGQKTKTTLLIQEISILENRVQSLEKDMSANEK
ncbi:MAG: DUF2304 domain-containing protein [Erysipelotrichaceae bacterium]|nr:DUF2304 domain-containing protein [Erysipelotrichaceae bacterium]